MDNIEDGDTGDMVSNEAATEDEPDFYLRPFVPMGRPSIDPGTVERASSRVRSLRGYKKKTAAEPVAPESAPEIDFVVAEEHLTAMREKMRYCLRIKEDGSRCRKFAVSGYRYCQFHIPNQEFRRVPPQLAPITELPQPTFQECRVAKQAIADGKTQVYWQSVPGALKLRHILPDETLHTEFAPSDMFCSFFEWLGSRVSVASLPQHLSGLTFDSVILFGVCVALAIRDAHYTVTLDELVGYMGWEPKTRAERMALKRQVWHWLLIFDSLKVIGARKRRFYKRESGRYENINSYDSLLLITGFSFEEQLAIDGTAVPIDVSLVAGPWLNEHRHDHRVLTFFGNLLTLAEKRRGQPSQRLAVYLGMALNQKWREGASRASVGRAGTFNELSVTVGQFTRAELLSVFGGGIQQEFERMLTSRDPQRARKCWDDAVATLKAWKFVGFVAPTPAPMGRQNWQHEWYTGQKLDIRPNRVSAAAIAEIAQSGKRAAEARRKRAVGKNIGSA